MKFWRSPLGIVLLILYVILAIWARVHDLNPDPSMSKNFFSTLGDLPSKLVSLPGLLVLNVLGVDVEYPDSSQFLIGISITAIAIYLIGVLIERGCRAAYRWQIGRML
jgi:hypothetical protein